MLVGHSMGSLIALEAAAGRPERIGRLVMVGTAYPMKVSDGPADHRLCDAPLAGHRHGQRVSISHAGQPNPATPAPACGCTAANRALMRRSVSGPERDGLRGQPVPPRLQRCATLRPVGWTAAAKVTAKVTMALGHFDQMTPPRATRDIAAALKAKDRDAAVRPQPDGRKRPTNCWPPCAARLPERQAPTA
jgi:pimeloyl-ACP methyl ester carboxylesterase